LGKTPPLLALLSLVEPVPIAPLFFSATNAQISALPPPPSLFFLYMGPEAPSSPALEPSYPHFHSGTFFFVHLKYFSPEFKFSAVRYLG